MLKTSSIVIIICISFIIVKTSFAQTSGPSQPEVQSFQAISVKKMVEPSTGEFQYNIPLVEVGGYPVTLNYNSQIGMDTEASMVGLGFNVNVGSITRNARGLPDDFNGDIVRRRLNMKDNITTSVTFGVSMEFVGFNKKDALGNVTDNLGFGFSSKAGLVHNSYSGWAIESGAGLGLSANSGGLSGNAGIGLNSNSNHGTSIGPYFGLGYSMEKAWQKEKKVRQKDGTEKIIRKKFKVGAEAGASYDYNTMSYSPKMDIPFSTTTRQFDIKGSYAFSLASLGGNVSGYRTEQKLETHQIENPAFGFLYAEIGKDLDKALMDFNRENEGVITEETPNLTFSYATPDVYSVAGHGVGGIFEIKRNNVFIGFDPKTKSKLPTYGDEFEVGGGPAAFHLGAEIRLGYTVNEAGKWQVDKNKLLKQIEFLNPFTASNTPISEQTYFKNPSDIMFNNTPLYNFTNFKPISPIIGFGGNTPETEETEVLLGTQNRTISQGVFVNGNRDNRLETITTLTAEETSKYGLEKIIKSNTLNQFGANNIITSINRVDNIRKGHHLSEMSCLKPDGSKFVFNVPAYNISKRELNYSVNENSVSNNTTGRFPDLVGEITNANQGVDDYVSETTTPGFAHSFLLGAVLQANYIDVDDNGPTPNDIGDYTKFNYSRVDANYYWRNNNNLNEAPADLGKMANKRDARAYYTEGEKEIWYIHSAESKNEELRFYYSDRQDKLIQASNSLKRLDSILVFTKAELLTNTPIPFKRIYFDYDNSLCKGIFQNSNLGKLTLKKLYFKDGSSNKGKKSPYIFNYSSSNPSYNINAMDRWGTYKPINSNAQINMGSLDNNEFSFVVQNKSLRPNLDINASAWLLNNIKLPSGGEIKVDYEAHDYAFVQNKRAMFMAKVMGVGDEIPTNNSITSQTLTKYLYNPITKKEASYLFFKLEEQINASSISEANDKVRQLYFTDNNDQKYGTIINGNAHNLYGKFRVNLNSAFGDEDIEMFLDANDCGALKKNGVYNYGYVRLNNPRVDKLHNNRTSLIAKNTWQYIKHEYPSILFKMDPDPALSAVELNRALLNMMNPAINTARSILQLDPDWMLYNDIKAAQYLDTTSCYIRLYKANGFKVGGAGARVNKISIADNWDVMAGGQAVNKTYDTYYDYTKIEDGKKISSGVAGFEPDKGGDENPWTQPLEYTIKNGMMPDENEYLKQTSGQSLFPSPTIIYSEVKIIENPIVTNGTIKSTIGYSKNNFYTFYDFPCSSESTPIQLIRSPKFKFSIFKNYSNDYMTATQGHSVVTNNIHGMAKSEEIFGEGENLISGKYFKYKVTRDSTKLNKLVSSINSEGKVSQNQVLGIEAQLTGDSRSYYTRSFSGSLHGNVDFQTYGIIPVTAISLYPDFSMEEKTFTSFTLNAHYRQQAILDSVTVVDKGASFGTKNLVWDAKTGAVLLTKSNNEFKDPVYNFTYPAHWAYTGMGMASDNVGTVDYIRTTFNNTSLKNYLNPGDILGVDEYKYVVNSISANSINTTPLYKNTPLLGTISNPTNSNPTIVKVLISGKKNLSTTPISSFTSLFNPIQLNSLTVSPGTKVLNSEAVEYANMSSYKCGNCGPDKPDPKAAVNRLIDQSYAMISPWQQLATYKFVDDRDQTNTNPNLRKDGFITNFTPFWMNNNSYAPWPKTANPKWQYTSKLSYVDNRLNPAESYNPLQIFSASQPSNIDGLVYTTTNNSRYYENFFESFEEIVDSCITNHFQLSVNNSNRVATAVAHTGNRSLLTDANGFTQVFIGALWTDKTKYDTLITECDAIKKLSLLPGKKYIFSAWVKEKLGKSTTLDYLNADVNIVTGSGGANNTFIGKPKGQIIDGWQRIEQEFTASTQSLSKLKLEFAANCYYDDIRIHPADALMKSYVYNQRDYSLSAILDENNFATFYEYDQQKQLKRVKKETQKGIATIQEVNFGSFKQ